MSRHRFDHDRAFELYIALPAAQRTYAEVARQVGASETSVRRWAREERWEERLAEASARGVRKALKNREELSAQVVRIYQRAAEQVELALDPAAPALDVAVVFAKFPEIHRIYRLEIGEATDHVAVAEVQAALRTGMSTAVEVVRALAAAKLGEKKGREFTLEFRELFFQSFNDALALEPGGGDA